MRSGTARAKTPRTTAEPSERTPRHPRRHKHVWLWIDDRLAAMRWMLSELLAMRDADRARRDIAQVIHRAKHADRRPLVGYEGRGAPWSDIDRRVQSANGVAGVAHGAEQLEQLEDVLGCALNDALARGLSPQGAALLAARMRRLLLAGCGTRAAGSIDAVWCALARGVLAHHEIARVRDAADAIGDGPRDRASLDAALVAARRDSEDDEAERAKVAESFRRLHDRGWRFAATTRKPA